MTLLTNDTSDFNLTLNLNVNYDLEYLELTVALRYKQKRTCQLKQFPASDFAGALHEYRRLEKMFF